MFSEHSPGNYSLDLYRRRMNFLVSKLEEKTTRITGRSTGEESVGMRGNHLSPIYCVATTRRNTCKELVENQRRDDNGQDAGVSSQRWSSSRIAQL